MALQSIKPRPPVNSPNRFGGDTAIAGTGGATGGGGENAQLDAVRHARGAAFRVNSNRRERLILAGNQAGTLAAGRPELTKLHRPEMRYHLRR